MVHFTNSSNLSASHMNLCPGQLTHCLLCTWLFTKSHNALVPGFRQDSGQSNFYWAKTTPLEGSCHPWFFFNLFFLLPALGSAWPVYVPLLHSPYCLWHHFLHCRLCPLIKDGIYPTGWLPRSSLLFGSITVPSPTLSAHGFSTKNSPSFLWKYR